MEQMSSIGEWRR